MEKTEKRNVPKNGTALQKLKLLFTIVDRRKSEFYADYLQQFDVNLQTAMIAEGTARTETLQMLGLTETQKALLVSVIREDMVSDALAGLEEKFNTVRDGKGIAFTVPMSSMIGVAAYQFLSNNRR